MNTSKVGCASPSGSGVTSCDRRSGPEMRTPGAWGSPGRARSSVKPGAAGPARPVSSAAGSSFYLPPQRLQVSQSRTPDVACFGHAIASAEKRLRSNALVVTLLPDCRHPETGFSWVECIEAVANDVQLIHG